MSDKSSLTKKISDRVARRIQDGKESEASEPRRLQIEPLEPRILFSGAAPAPAPEPAPEPAATGDAGSPPVDDTPTTPTPVDTGITSSPESAESGVVASYEDPALSVALPQETAESGQEAPANPLAQDQLASIVQAATQRWIESGISTEQADALATAQYEIADLGGTRIGSTDGTTVLIDTDAGGRGWFVDSTPLIDNEFVGASIDSENVLTAGENGPAEANIDLLTVILHEQGHLLGLEDTLDGAEADNIMYGGFNTGSRILPVAGQALGAEPGSVEGVHAAVYNVTNFADGTTGGTLREAIIAVNASTEELDTINLSAGTYTLTLAGGGNNSAASGDLDITKVSKADLPGAIEIVGQGAGVTIIDASLLGDRVFHITQYGVDVTFRDLTITGGTPFGNDHGGGFRNDEGTVTLENVELTGNSTAGNSNTVGAGFYSRGVGASVTVIGGSIHDNTSAYRGGGFYVDSDSSVVTIENSALFDNHAGDGAGDGNEGGGGFWANGGATVNITNTDIVGNTAQLHGGGFRITDRAVVNLVDADIRDNEAGSDGVGGNGNLGGQGGGFFAESENNLVNISSTAGQVVIQDNISRGEHGGGFSNRGLLNLTNVDIISNETLGSGNDNNVGGGFYNEGLGAVNLIDSNIKDNTAWGRGAGFYNNAGFVNMSTTGGQVAIDNNQVLSDDREGGGFWASDNRGEVILSNVDITNNSSSHHGGGFRVNDAHVEITDGVIQSNTVTRTDRQGGGFHLGGNASVDLDNVDILDNTAGNRGGGFSVETDRGKVTMIDGDIRRNESLTSHGGGFSSQGVVDLKNVLIDDNHTRGSGNDDHRGGGFWQVGNQTKTTLNNVQITNNTAFGGGGGFTVNDGLVEGTDVTIEDNEILSSSRRGGGFWSTGQGSVNIDTGSISNNTSTEHGGGFHIQDNSNVVLTDVDVIGNTAGQGAGGFFVESDRSNVTMTRGDIADNVALENHAGGFWTRGRVELTDVDILRNSTAITATEGTNPDDVGGGFFSENPSVVVITGGSIVGNTAGGRGAGFYNANGNVTITNAPIKDNVVISDRRSAGGFWNSSNGRVTITGDGTMDTAISGNVATEHGGGFHNRDNGVVTITNVLIDSNKTEHSVGDTNNNNVGGGIWTESNNSKTILIDSAVTNNTAEGRGGGVYNSDGLFQATNTVISGNEIIGTAVNTGVTINQHGGGIWNRGQGRVELENVNLDNNVATAGGGGFWQENDTTFTMNGGSISGNTANTNQGGGFFNHHNGRVELTDVNVDDNYSGSYGGGFVTHEANGRVSLTDVTLNNNTANEDGNNPGNALSGSNVHGGGARVRLGQVDMTRVEVSGNRILGPDGQNFVGGGLAIEGGDVRMTDSVIDGNHATGRGGGAFLWSSGTLEVENTTISNNAASGDVQFGTSGAGGGVYLESNSSFTATNSTISGNRAGYNPFTTTTFGGRQGGGIFTNGSGTVDLTHSTVAFNEATGNAGGIDHNGGTVTIRDTIVSNNVAGGSDPDLQGTINTPGTNLILDPGSATLVDTGTPPDTINNPATVGDVHRPVPDSFELIFATANTAADTDLDLSNPIAQIDGKSVLEGDVVIVKNQDANPEQNGLYRVLSGNMFVRHTQMDDPGEGPGLQGTASTNANGGLTNQGKTFRIDSAATITIGTTPVQWIEGVEGQEIIGVDPLLQPLANNGGPNDTHALLAGTAAVDAATLSSEANDQRGEARRSGGFADIGAFELQSVTGAPAAITGVTVPPVSLGGSANLTAAGTGDGTLTFSWIVTDPFGTVSNATGSSYNFTPSVAGAHEVVVILSDADGDSDSQTHQLDVAYTVAAGLADGAAGSLRDAIDIAHNTSGDFRIELATGTHSLTIAGNNNTNRLLGDLDLFKTDGKITVVGGDADSSLTVIDAGGSTGTLQDRHFQIWADANLELEDLTLSGGYVVTGDNDGGAIRNERHGTVSLTNVDVSDNEAISGGGIFNVEHNATVNITDSRITDNYSRAHGGGFWNRRGDVNVTDSVVSGNTADGGLDNNDGHGGGFWNNEGGTVTLNGDVEIDNNTAAGHGGGFWNQQTSMVDGSNLTFVSIQRNEILRTDRDGAGFMNQENGEVTLVNATISDNGAGDGGATDRPTNGRRGGGFHNQNAGIVTITGGSVDGNRTLEHGGGFWNSDSGVVTLTGVTINDNIADNQGGGFITLGNSTTNITDGEIDGNRSQVDRGGGFSARGTVNLTRTDITNNFTEGSGNDDRFGAGFWAVDGQTRINIVDGNVVDNDAWGRGAGFFVNAGAQVHFTLDQNATTQITGNDVLSSDRTGGGFQVESRGIVTIEGGVIENNTSTSHGAGFWADTGSTVEIKATAANPGSISNNTVTRSDRGGGGFWSRIGSEVDLKNVNIVGNTAGTIGGGWVSEHSSTSVTLDNSEMGAASLGISGNVAGNGDGGGFFNRGTVILTNVPIDSNEAGGSGNPENDGGGFYQDSNRSSVTLIDSAITNNTAYGRGAGFYNAHGSVTTNADISDNRVLSTRRSAGGFWNSGGGEVTITGTTTIPVNISENISTEHGGGFHNREGGTVTLTNVNVTDNSTPHSTGDGNNNNIGGGIWQEQSGSTVLMDNVTIDGNTSEGRGGGIYNNNGDIYGTDVRITNNTAPNTTSQGVTTAGQGGGIWTSGRSTVVLDNATINGNTAREQGGGIFATNNSTVSLTDSDVSNNTSTQSRGGGIAMDNQGNVLNLTDTTVTGNRALQNHAGGIDNRGTANLLRTTVDGNETFGNPGNNHVGGGIWNRDRGSVLNLTESTVSNNIAYGRGGGIYNNGGIVNAVDTSITGNVSAAEVNNEDRSRGGGIWNSGNGAGAGGLINFDGVTLANNSAQGHGGGLFQQDFGVGFNAVNSTISGNFAGFNARTGTFRDGVGGGFWAISDGSVVLDHVTISDNKASRGNADTGAGFRVDSGGNTLLLKDSIVYGNLRDADTATPIADDVENLIGNRLTVEGNNIIGVATQNPITSGNVAGISSADPLLAPLADNGGPTETHLLLAGSAAIDAATTSTLAEDQRGFFRTSGAADIGAFEFAPVYVNDDWAGTADGTSLDGDLEETGIQNAIFGTSAFATINDAVTALGASAAAQIIVNDGTYAESVALPNGSQDFELQFVNGNSSVTSITGDAGDSLALGGFDANHTTAVTLTLDSGNIGGDISGTGGIDKQSAGSLTLGGSNTYSGATNVNGGSLFAGNTTAFGTGEVTADTGTVLDLGTFNVANDITLNGARMWIQNGASGTITLNNVAGNEIFARGNYHGLTGQITGAGGVTFGGTGVPGIQLTNSSNDFAGDVTINSGAYLRLIGSELLPDTVTVTVNGNLRLEGGGNIETIAGLEGGGSVWIPLSAANHTLVVGAGDTSSTFNGQMVPPGQTTSLTLVKTGTGTFTMNGPGLYSGGTIISQGTLMIGNPDALGSGTVTINDTNTGSSDTALLATFANAGNSIINDIVVANQGTGTTTIGTTTFNVGGVPTYYDGDTTLNKATTFQGGNADRTTYRGNISGTPGLITVNGGARTTWDETNTFTGDVLVTGSGTVLQVARLAGGTADQIPDASNVQVDAGAIFQTALGDGETINELSGDGTVRTIAGSNTLTVSGGTFTGLITDDGGNGGSQLSLTKEGAGTLTLTNAGNDFDGVLRINDGIISVPTLTPGNTNSPIGAMFGISSNLIFDGGTLQYTGGTVGGINRAFTVAAGGGTIEVTNPAATVTWTDASGAGPITGPGTLTKDGPGTLWLSGANNYGGGTIVSDGTLIVSNNTGAGSGAVTLGDASTGSGDVAFLVANSADINNAITVSSSGTGTATIGSSGPGIGGNNTNIGGTVTLDRATIFQGTATDRTTFSGAITGNPSTITVNGGSRTVFTGASNTFVGDVDITGSGTALQIGVVSGPLDQIPDASNVNLGAGTTLLLSTTAETINGLTGTGTVRPNSPSGGTATLTIGAGNSTGTFAGDLNNNGGQVLAIVKEGNGTQTFNIGTNNFGGSATGGITVNDGTVRLEGNQGFNEGYFDNVNNVPYTINAGGTLEIAGNWITRSNSIYDINGGTLSAVNPSGTDWNYVNLLNFDTAPGTIDGTSGIRTGYFFDPTYTVSAAASGSQITTSLRMFDQGGVTDALTIDVADGAASSDFTISGQVIADPAWPGLGLTKTGDGTLTLAGTTNTYNGTTRINAGTLALIGNTTINDTPEIAVATGAVFDVSGRTAGGYTFGNSVTGGGTTNGSLAISSGGDLLVGDNSGADVGIFTINGDFTGTLGATLDLALDGEAGAGTVGGHDQLVVNGVVTLNDLTLDITFDNFLAENGDSFTIIDNNGAGDAVIGTFDGLPEGTIFFAPGGQTFEITYAGGDGNDVVLSALGETGVTIDANRTLRIEDISGNDTDDTISVSVVGGQLVIHDPNQVLTSDIPNAGRPDANTVVVDLIDFEDMVIATGGGNDDVTVGDMAGFDGSLDIIGGDGFDTVTFSSGMTLALGVGTENGTDENLTVDAEKFFANYDAAVSVVGTGTIDIDATGGAGDFNGIQIKRASLSSEDGDITLDGVGGDTGNANDGVLLSHGTQITTAGGSVAISGTGTSPDGANDGVSLVTGSDITVGGDGTITLEGTSSGENWAYGVLLFTGSELTTANGDISLVGTSDSTGSGNSGIYTTGATVSAGGVGSVNLDGQGAGAGANSDGLRLIKTTIETAGGDITLTGTGGGGTKGNTGVEVGVATSVTTGGTGNVTITGSGAGSSTANNGVAFISGSSVASGGDITVTGTAGTGTSYNVGISLSSASLTAAGNLAVTGEGNGSGSKNRGIYSSKSDLAGAEVTLTGTGSLTASGKGNDGIYINRGSATAAGTLTIAANGGTGNGNSRGFLASGTTLMGTLDITGTANSGTTGKNNTGVHIQNSTLDPAGTITGTAGGGTANNFGVYMKGIGGSFDPSNVTGNATEDEDKTGGNFFSILPLLMAEADRRTTRRSRKEEKEGKNPLQSIADSALSLWKSNGRSLTNGATLIFRDANQAPEIVDSSTIDEFLGLNKNLLSTSSLPESAYRALFITKSPNGELSAYCAPMAEDGTLAEELALLHGDTASVHQLHSALDNPDELEALIRSLNGGREVPWNHAAQNASPVSLGAQMALQNKTFGFTDA